MAQPSQPTGNRNLKTPNKTKAPIPVEPVNVPQEQREGLTQALTDTDAGAPALSPPQGTFDPATILRTGSLRAQATTLQRLNTAQGREAAAHIGSAQGNRHLSRLVSSLNRSPGKPGSVQAKLTVSEPDDQYEKQADQVADQVMRMAAPPPPPAGEDENTPGIQRSPSALPGSRPPLFDLDPSLPGSATLAARAAMGAPDVTPDLEQTPDLGRDKS